MSRVLCIGGPLDGRTEPYGGALIETAAAPGKPSVLYILSAITFSPDKQIQFYMAEGVTEWGAVVRVFTAYAKGAK